MRFNILTSRLKNFHPKDSMFISKEEIEYIVEQLELNNLSNDDLLNLRDFVVLEWSNEQWIAKLNGDSDTYNKYQVPMMSITAVIDNEKFKRSLEP